MVGVIQEQHADRYELFAQWKQLDFPVLHDPMTKMGIKVVPVFVAIDEHGIVRSTRPSLRNFKESFLDVDFEAPETEAPKIDKNKVTPSALSAKFKKGGFDNAWMILADAHLLTDKKPNYDDIITYYQVGIDQPTHQAETLFRLGVVHRMRFESDSKKIGDFAKASEYWTRALAIDPNHYIWRRRIQQYGPEMSKPYPFYNWVDQARKDISKRGETPVKLASEPKGAELAMPSRQFKQSEGLTNPDEKARIHLDSTNLIDASLAAVPSQASAGSTVRMHLNLQPSATAKWNNEAEKTKVWVNSVNGLNISQQLIEIDQPETAESKEARNAEFEIAIPKDAKESVKVSGFVLFYVCESDDGQCLYLRKNFETTIPIVERKRRR